MKKALKIAFKFFAFFILLFGILLMGSWWYYANQILDSQEQDEQKKGKQFWEWQSPYGPLTFHYVEKGKGDKHVLLLHGFRARTYTWKALIAPLAEAGYHVWAIDFIGFGLSDKPTHLVYNLDFFVEQIHAFIEGHGIKQADYIGNSMGGGVALASAIAYPEEVRSLALLSPLGYPLDLPLYISLSRDLSWLWSPFLGPVMVRFGLEQIVYNKAIITEEQVDAYALPYRFPGGIDASVLTLQQFDNRILERMQRQYAKVKCPLLVIWGTHDTLIPPAHYDCYLRDFSKVDGLLIPNCGHIPQEETPDQVLVTLLPFLDKGDKRDLLTPPSSP